MKFTKTALTLALVAVSGSAMAEVVDNPIDGTPVEAPVLGGQTTAEQKVHFYNKMMMASGKMAYAEVVDGEAVFYSGKGKVLTANEALEKVEDAAAKNHARRTVDRKERQANRQAERGGKVYPDPIVVRPYPGDIEPGNPIHDITRTKLDWANKHLAGKTHVIDIADITGNPEAVLSNMHITAEGTLEAKISYVSGEGQTVEKYVSYDMTGEHAQSIIKEAIAKAPKTDPKLPPSIGPVEPGNPDNGPGIEDPVGPINGGEGRAAYDSLVEAGQNLEQAGQSAYTTMNEIYDLGNQNAQDIETLFGEVDRLDERIDGVMASAQAVTAARPYLSTNQTSSVGVGVGYAGDVAAVAVGYAHRINPNWTANANVSATTGSDVDVSAGAGISYAW